MLYSMENTVVSDKNYILYSSVLYYTVLYFDNYSVLGGILDEHCTMNNAFCTDFK